MIPYVENFLTLDEADEMFEFVKGQRFVRPNNKRNKTSRLRRLSFPGYSPDLSAGHKFRAHVASDYDVSGTIEDAPQLYKGMAARLTEYAASQGLPVPVNYLSTIGYLTDDHMNAHQHSEDRIWKDQTVYVVSFGAVHPIQIIPGATVPVLDKKTGKLRDKFMPSGDEYTIHPKHGSLYVLPSAFNEIGSGNEHQHAVLEGDDYSYGGLRIAINCKHVPLEAGPRVYSVRARKQYPSDGVYVGREVRDRRNSKVLWPGTPFGNTYEVGGQRVNNEKDFRSCIQDKLADPAFRAELEKLRGKNLLCWHDHDYEGFCHAKVWLELANR